MGNVIGEFTGANRRAAAAAQGAAESKERQAGLGLASAQDTQRQLLAAANDPEALARIESQIGLQEKQVSRQEQLIEAIDPALKEAAVQALGLLQGKEAASLGPAKAQRERQRNQLMNTLREQLGPGAETSTAGIQALTQFDAETNNLIAQQQQSTLGGLLGLTAQSRPDIGGEIGRLSQIAGQKFGRQSQALSQGGAFVQNAFAPTIASAGSQFVGEGLRARQMQGIGSDIFKGGLALAGGGFFNPGAKTNDVIQKVVGGTNPLIGASKAVAEGPVPF